VVVVDGLRSLLCLLSLLDKIDEVSHGLRAIIEPLDQRGCENIRLRVADADPSLTLKQFVDPTAQKGALGNLSVAANQISGNVRQ
jgi:hypothetical protein